MIVARVRRTLEERGLLGRGARVLIACSGGPDSAALLLALARLATDLELELYAASVDHGLRPSAAQDVAIAREQAAAVGVPFRALEVTVAAGPSLQAEARRARYAALLALASELSAERLAVGHTRDDQAETVLMRVLRGGGLGGLSGIRARRADGVIRPLIDCARGDAQAFARQYFSRVACDPTNTDPRFGRVRVRQELMPVVLREDPRAVEHLCDLADDASELEAALVEMAAVALERASQGTERIDVSILAAELPAVRKRALRDWVERITGSAPGRAQLRQLDHTLMYGGEVWLTGDYLALRSDGSMSLSRRDPAAERPP